MREQPPHRVALFTMHAKNIENFRRNQTLRKPACLARQAHHRPHASANNLQGAPLNTRGRRPLEREQRSKKFFHQSRSKAFQSAVRASTARVHPCAACARRARADRTARVRCIHRKSGRSCAQPQRGRLRHPAPSRSSSITRHKIALAEPLSTASPHLRLIATSSGQDRERSRRVHNANKRAMPARSSQIRARSRLEHPSRVVFERGWSVSWVRNRWGHAWAHTWTDTGAVAGSRSPDRVR